jgi:O-antigen/teichoic acid export membrane protein
VWRYVAQAGGAAAVLSVFVCIGSDAIVSALFGPAFRSSARVLEVVAPALAFSTVAAVLGRAAFAGGGQAAIARITAIAALANIAANCVVVPAYGISGASVTTLATFGASAVAHWWYCARLGVAPPTLLGVGLLGALTAGVVVGFQLPLDDVLAAPIGSGITALAVAGLVRLSRFRVHEPRAGSTELREAHGGWS